MKASKVIVLLILLSVFLLLFTCGLIVLMKSSKFVDVGERYRAYLVTIIAHLACLIAWMTILVLILALFVKSVRLLYFVGPTMVILALVFVLSAVAFYFENWIVYVDSLWKVYEADEERRDSLQSERWCCGFLGPAQYNGTIPASCYQPGAEGITNYLWEDGCRSVLETQIRQYFCVLIGTAFMCSILSFFIGVLSFCFANYLRRCEGKKLPVTQVDG